MHPRPVNLLCLILTVFSVSGVLRANAQIRSRSVVPTIDVIQRRSTDVLAVDDDAVAAALRWIREHVAEQFHVDAVTEQVPVNRRTLEMRFRQHLGRSINESIQ